MRRRDLLTGAFALMSLPPLLRRGFAERCEPRSSARAVARLTSAWKRAHAARKPLLVLVVPEADAASAGRRWGVLLSHADRDVMARLATFEITCARIPELAALAPTAAQHADATFFVIDTTRVPAAPRPYRATFGPIAWNDDRWVDESLAALQALIRPLAQVDSAYEAALAEDAIARLRARPPAGSLWATDWGCGSRVDVREEDAKRLSEEERRAFGLDGGGYLCGQGHVPERAERFLVFYSAVAKT